MEYLIVSSHQDKFQLQLQTILDQATNLNTLNIRQDISLPLQKSLFKYRNSVVYRLNFQDNEYYFNENQCLELTHSPLGIQCKILFIKVKTLQCIIILIKNMIPLRTLIVQYHNQINIQLAKFSFQNTSNKDEIIQWLKDRLLSICVIVKGRNISNLIHIWMK